MLDRIVAKVDEVRGLITEISASTEAQASNLQQVNGAIGDMDSRTQQNAAMVEQSTAAERSLDSEASQLLKLVSRFNIRRNENEKRRPVDKPATIVTVPHATRKHTAKGKRSGRE